MVYDPPNEETKCPKCGSYMTKVTNKPSGLEARCLRAECQYTWNPAQEKWRRTDKPPLEPFKDVSERFIESLEDRLPSIPPVEKVALTTFRVKLGDGVLLDVKAEGVGCSDGIYKFYIDLDVFFYLTVVDVKSIVDLSKSKNIKEYDHARPSTE